MKFYFFFGQNLRSYYEEQVKLLQEKDCSIDDDQAYQALTSQSDKQKDKDGKTPAEKLLAGANFTYLQGDNSSDKDSLTGSSFPNIRAAFLKNKEIYDSMKQLLHAWQHRTIPHSGVEKAKDQIIDLFGRKKETKEIKQNAILQVMKNNK